MSNMEKKVSRFINTMYICAVLQGVLFGGLFAYVYLYIKFH